MFSTNVEVNSTAKAIKKMTKDLKALMAEHTA